MIWDMEQENMKLNWGIKPMKRERTTNGTRAKLENMSYGQTVASKEQCQCTGSWGREVRRRGLDMERDREGAGEGKKRKGT